jgi:hypothetical protein
VGQDERPAPLQVVVVEEPRPAIGEVAFPLLVMEDLDEVQGLATAMLVGVFFPIVPTKLAGSGRRSSHPASRCTMEVAYPCFGV